MDKGRICHGQTVIYCRYFTPTWSVVNRQCDVTVWTPRLPVGQSAVLRDFIIGSVTAGMDAWPCHALHVQSGLSVVVWRSGLDTAG